jgi:hypothetical protein
MLTFNVMDAPTKMPGASYSLWTLNEILRSAKARYSCSWGWKLDDAERRISGPGDSPCPKPACLESPTPQKPRR